MQIRKPRPYETAYYNGMFFGYFGHIYSVKEERVTLKSGKLAEVLLVTGSFAQGDMLVTAQFERWNWDEDLGRWNIDLMTNADFIEVALV